MSGHVDWAGKSAVFWGLRELNPGDQIEVQDTDRHWPQPRTPDGYDESGFGFILVDALSSNWGVRETDSGKAVWAELDTRRESGPGI